jgi:hypothetical protein
MAVAQLLPRLSARRRRHAGLIRSLMMVEMSFALLKSATPAVLALLRFPFIQPRVAEATEKRSAPTVSRLLELSCTTVLHLVWLRRHPLAPLRSARSRALPLMGSASKSSARNVGRSGSAILRGPPARRISTSCGYCHRPYPALACKVGTSRSLVPAACTKCSHNYSEKTSVSLLNESKGKLSIRRFASFH